VERTEDKQRGEEGGKGDGGVKEGIVAGVVDAVTEFAG
jgi:hypothetical protein